eukprot:TRINITY_DN20665_c0_g1_i1.p1 TRINITY_DN20665_c0_g1~~TRINITY_DN20665_c0_g1_i1.p1  ORF type:complete len:527 (-),score=103.12 TRINITY_DN20665_c0_g1_i1:55-1509(-)
MKSSQAIPSNLTLKEDDDNNAALADYAAQAARADLLQEDTPVQRPLDLELLPTPIMHSRMFESNGAEFLAKFVKSSEPKDAPSPFQATPLIPSIGGVPGASDVLTHHHGLSSLAEIVSASPHMGSRGVPFGSPDLPPRRQINFPVPSALGKAAAAAAPRANPDSGAAVQPPKHESAAAVLAALASAPEPAPAPAPPRSAQRPKTKKAPTLSVTSGGESMVDDDDPEVDPEAELAEDPDSESWHSNESPSRPARRVSKGDASRRRSAGKHQEAVTRTKRGASVNQQRRRSMVATGVKAEAAAVVEAAAASGAVPALRPTSSVAPVVLTAPPAPSTGQQLPPDSAHPAKAPHASAGRRKSTHDMVDFRLYPGVVEAIIQFAELIYVYARKDEQQIADRVLFVGGHLNQQLFRIPRSDYAVHFLGAETRKTSLEYIPTKLRDALTNKNTAVLDAYKRVLDAVEAAGFPIDRNCMYISDMTNRHGVPS